MITSHTIHCANDWCDEYSTRISFQGTDTETLAREHRSAIAADGWSDVEGRDYCPEHREG